MTGEQTAGLRERIEAARSLADTLDTRGTRSMDSDLCAAAGLLRLLAENVADRDRLAAESQSAAALERITVESVQQLVETRTRLAKVEADRDRLAAEVAERQAYLETLREQAGKNYGEAKKLRRWLDEERDAVKMYCAEADGAAATVARLRAAVSRALDLLGREHHYESSYTAQGIAILREAHDGSGEASRG